MSISNLFEPNNYDIHCNEITANTYNGLTLPTVEDLVLTWQTGSGSITGSTVTLKVIRYGKLCTLMLTDRINVTFAGGDFPYLILPVGYRSNVGVGGLAFTAAINNPSVGFNGFVEISTGGDVFWYGTQNFGAFTAGAGWLSPVCITYILE